LRLSIPATSAAPRTAPVLSQGFSLHQSIVCDPNGAGGASVAERVIVHADMAAYKEFVTLTLSLGHSMRQL